MCSSLESRCVRLRKQSRISLTVFQRRPRARCRSQLGHRSCRNSNCKLVSPGLAEDPAGTDRLSDNARTAVRARKSGRSPSKDAPLESTRTEKGSRAHLVWRIAGSADRVSHLGSLQRRRCDPARRLPRRVVPPRLSRLQEEQSERLTFSY